ncbi:hypothetical protein [Pedobacter rhizosphaerae]|uniref:Uncharacterized protein n=1 Tax=Pedobacter rhizosphaerae TaxID=390241 RepID=A0A1H9VKV3_9SPHI|nr:hypothetical protein [Pedobacter rhizosphaerae]SES22222.1 hypothetical protein SAMN04488023_14430 [Pedobacter rhizosphaerae]
MKKVLFFLLVCLISTLTLWACVTLSEPELGLGTALLILLLYCWYNFYGYRGKYNSPRFKAD